MGGGALLGVPLFFLLKEPASIGAASLCMVLVMLPFFLLGLYERHGQPLEKVLWHILQVTVFRPKIRPYRTNNFYLLLKRQDQLDQEVYRIVHKINRAP